MAQVQEVDVAPSNGTGGPGRGKGTPNVQVNWGLKPASKLPPRRVGGFARNQEVDNALDSIKGDANLHGQAFELGVYDPDDDRSSNAARAKASSLRKRYPKEEGWTFVVGDSENEPGRVALFVQYG